MNDMGKGVELTGKDQVKIYPITASDLVYDKDTKKNMKQSLNEKVEEAPMDGKQYARINGAWGEVEAGSVSETALITLLPNDSALYGATVKVTTNEGDTLLDTTWQGSVLSVQVRAGLVYTVTVGEKDGYIAPSAVNYTAEKGVTRSISMTYTESTLTVNVLSNQGTSDSDISNVKATVTYGSTSVQVGNGEKINLPLNVAVTITFPSVTNYKAPDSISFTHTGSAVQKSGTYQTEVVNVTLSADNGTSVLGQIVTINGTQHTWTGTTISQKVAFGTSYSVSVDAKAGYTTPSSQSFTASQSSRNLSLVYYERLGTKTPGVGIFVQDTEGYFLTKEEWDRGHHPALPNGIAVITDQHSFVMSLEMTTYSYYWGTTDYVAGISSPSTQAAALLDFDGKDNTDAFIAYKPDGANLFKACNDYVFPNGQTGYFYSIGELSIIYENMDEITDVLRSANGDNYASIWGSSVLISSSQYNEDKVWWLYRATGALSTRTKNDDSYSIRILTTLEL